MPPRKLPLWSRRWSSCREDECVEVTPRNVRLRKVVLDQTVRGRTRARSKRQA